MRFGHHTIPHTHKSVALYITAGTLQTAPHTDDKSQLALVNSCTKLETAQRMHTVVVVVVVVLVESSHPATKQPHT